MQFPQETSALLPHKGVMRCIDTLVFCDTTTTRAEVLLQKGHAFLLGTAFDRAGFVELAAQTAGLPQGLALKEKGEVPALGLLVGVQDVEMLQDAFEGDLLCISVRREVELGNIHVLAFSVHRKETLLAQGKLKVYIPV